MQVAKRPCVRQRHAEVMHGAPATGCVCGRLRLSMVAKSSQGEAQVAPRSKAPVERTQTGTISLRLNKLAQAPTRGHAGEVSGTDDQASTSTMDNATVGLLENSTSWWRDLPSRYKVVLAGSLSFVICNMVSC